MTLVDDLHDPATTLTFTYPANDPGALAAPQLQNGNLPPPAQYYTFPLPDGHLRIWTKDGEADRDPAALGAGGDWVAPGVAYPLDTFEMDSLQRIVLYVEAVSPWSRALESATITVDAVAPPGSDLEGEELTDGVRALPVQLQVFDMRYWSPGAQSEDSVEFNNPAYDSYMPEARVQGALTDGASVCLVRLEPPVADVPCEIGRWKRGERAQQTASTHFRVFGGLRATSNGGGAPPLPLPAPGTISHTLAHGVTTESGLAFFVPPDDYLEEGYYEAADMFLNESLAMDSGEETELSLAIYVDGEGWPIAQSSFYLRRPPLVLVHGLKGAAAGYWGAAYDEGIDQPAPTRLYHADYSATNVRGYDVNLGIVPLQIQAALEEYRNHTDNIGSAFGEHAASRGFHGRSYAATRVDVVGHSMGGQITRLFISGVSAQGPRWRPLAGGGWVTTSWEDYDTRRTNGAQNGKWFYLRSDNFWSGDIRRFIPIGSPFLGSPMADMEALIETPTSAVRRAMLVDSVASNDERYQAIKDITLIQDALDRNIFVLYPNGFDEDPTALPDLRSGSVLQRLMDGTSPGNVGGTGTAAEYPVGHRALPWRPLIGQANSAHLPVDDPWTWAWNRCARIMSESMAELTGLNSDRVVRVDSQRNWDGTPRGQNEGIGDVFEDTVHAGSTTMPLTEMTSPFMVDRIGELLGYPVEYWYTEGLDK